MIFTIVSMDWLDYLYAYAGFFFFEFEENFSFSPSDSIIVNEVPTVAVA